MLLMGVGFASAVTGVVLSVADELAVHVAGYLVGSVIPILVIGLARRTDLDRRRSPAYRANGRFRPALAGLAVIAMVAAALHVWPIATELAS
ncbi:MAG: hypothetical protein R2702_15855 [Acidimicrobiales bacterium]